MYYITDTFYMQFERRRVMAQCDFLDYSYSRGWYCRKTDRSLDKNTVGTYCDNSLAYRDCPTYTGGGSSGGCYLTTACVECRNLADDCRELTVLRSFRDNYMANQENGKEDIKEYYDKAPKIVEIINAKENSNEIYDDLYRNVIKPCVELIENDKNEEAYQKYKEMVSSLEKKFM